MAAVIVVMQRRRKLSDFSSNWLCRKKKNHHKRSLWSCREEKKILSDCSTEFKETVWDWKTGGCCWSSSFTIAHINYILWQTPEFWMSWPLLQLFERMCMALGGRAAESVIFNHVTTGNCFCLFFCVPCADRGPFGRRRSPQVVKLKGRLGTALVWGQSWWTR